MREIKFRAWDKENKKMVYSDKLYPENMYKFNFDFFNNFKFLLMKLEIPDNAYLFEPIGNFDFEPVDAHIMQFTGIKDANGKDVYEGDIVKYFGFYDHDTAKIVFTDGCFALDNIRYTFATETFFDFFAHETNALIIIGNIYENPELLEG